MCFIVYMCSCLPHLSQHCPISVTPHPNQIPHFSPSDHPHPPSTPTPDRLYLPGLQSAIIMTCLHTSKINVFLSPFLDVCWFYIPPPPYPPSRFLSLVSIRHNFCCLCECVYLIMYTVMNFGISILMAFTVMFSWFHASQDIGGSNETSRS